MTKHDGAAFWRDRKVLIIGGTGFIGRRLVESLLVHRTTLAVFARHPEKICGSSSGENLRAIVGDLTDARTLRSCCEGVDTVIHLAGYAHATDQDSPEAKKLHQAITVEGTRVLLAAAVAAGVKRFVFLSSVKAMGERGVGCLDETAIEAPTTHYGLAKLEAEQLVLAAGKEHRLHVCVLRLPLVYGPGNKGNIPRMIAAIDAGRFPPVPDIQNKRSMVHVDDVVRALLLVVERPTANGHVYIVTDGRVYSTREIYMGICTALGRAVPAWTIPVWVLRLGARFGDAIENISRRTFPLTTSVLDKLLSSAWYSSAKIHRELGFVPRHTLFGALPEMIADYRRQTEKTLPLAS